MWPHMHHKTFFQCFNKVKLSKNDFYWPRAQLIFPWGPPTRSISWSHFLWVIKSAGSKNYFISYHCTIPIVNMSCGEKEPINSALFGHLLKRLTTISSSLHHLYFHGSIPLLFVIWFYNLQCYRTYPVISKKKCNFPLYVIGYHSLHSSMC